jgi:hypothetical protein
MCITFFSSHPTCTHTDLLGAWNCGLNCPNSTRHTFHLTSPGYSCSTCAFLHGDELDPDIVPVEYYAPPMDPEEDRREREGREKKDEEERVKLEEKMEREKELSDCESETEYWRGEHAGIQGAGNGYATPKQGGTVAQQQITPRTAAHKRLVRDQLKKVPKQGMPVQVRSMGHFAVFEPMGQMVEDTRFWIAPVQGGGRKG